MEKNPNTGLSDNLETVGEGADGIYEMIFQEIDDAVFLLDVKQIEDDYIFRFQRANDVYKQMSDSNEDELRGLTPREVYNNQLDVAIEAECRRCVEENNTIQYENEYEFQSKSICWQTKLTPILDDGQVAYIIGVARDITEQKEQQEALQHRNDLYETVCETMSAAVFLKDTDGQYRLMNKAGQELFDISNQEIIGLTDEDLFPSEVAQEARKDDQQVIESGDVIEIEEEIPTATGNTVRLTRKSPAYDASGEIIGVCGVSTDITEQKRREQEIDESNTVLRTIVENLPMGVLVEDANRDILITNDRLSQLFDLPLSADEMTGRDCVSAAENVKELFADPDAFIDGIEHRISERESVYDDELELADGRVLERHYTPYTLPDGPANLWLYRDISDRKEREQELQELTERFELAVTGGNIGIWDWDMTTDQVTHNNQWEEMLGYSLDETELHFDEWKQRVHSEDLAAVEEALDNHISGETDCYEAEYRMRTADGNWKWLRAIGRVVERDEGGEPVRAVGIYIDVNEQKAYEQTLEDQRNDLKVLNQMVRHDIRNNLHIVVSYAKMLTDNVENEDEEYLQKVIDSGSEAIDITQTAGEVTKAMLRSEADLTPRNLPSVLEGEIAQVRENHERALVSAEETLPDINIMADEMLESVFRNLLSNAITHNDKELPEVTVSATIDEEVVHVRIADNGPGIPDTQKGQIFCEGEKGLNSGGTGIGLYLVQTLVDRYNGAVWVEDNEPEGSVFIVELRCV